MGNTAERRLCLTQTPSPEPSRPPPSPSLHQNSSTATSHWGGRYQNVCLGGGGVRAGGGFVLLRSMKGQAASGLFRSTFTGLSPALGARHRQSRGRSNGRAVGFCFQTQRLPRRRGSAWPCCGAKHKHPKRSSESAFVLPIPACIPGHRVLTLPASGFYRHSSYFPETFHMQGTLVGNGKQNKRDA